jgi:hypothetical protein
LVSSDRRWLKIASESYVWADIDPEDSGASAAKIGLKLVRTHSFTFINPYEDISPDDVPEEAGLLAENANRAPGATRRGEADEPEEQEEPIHLRFADGVERKAGNHLCRMRSATYISVGNPIEDERGTWQEVRRQLSLRETQSWPEADVDVLPLSAASPVLLTWLSYGAADRVIVPLWPPYAIDDPDKMMAWRGIPATLEAPAAYAGDYLRVVAVYPEHVRGMTCRIWLERRDGTPGMGTLSGRYPVDVAVSVPYAKRCTHIYSFEEIRKPDWRPGLVFYGQTDSDGCPVSYLGERLERYNASTRQVVEPVWRAWLGG